jgi:hypothetical protein
MCHDDHLSIFRRLPQMPDEMLAVVDRRAADRQRIRRVG